MGRLVGARHENRFDRTPATDLGLLMPADVHHGLAKQRVAARTTVLATAYAAHWKDSPEICPIPRHLWRCGLITSQTAWLHETMCLSYAASQAFFRAATIHRSLPLRRPRERAVIGQTR
jgi:hypothetical protein